MIANQIQKRFCMKTNYELMKITEELPWHEFLGGFGSFWKSSDFFMKYHEKSWNVWKFCRLSQNEKGEYEWQTFLLIMQRPTIPVPVTLWHCACACALPVWLCDTVTLCLCLCQVPVHCACACATANNRQMTIDFCNSEQHMADSSVFSLSRSLHKLGK